MTAKLLAPPILTTEQSSLPVAVNGQLGQIVGTGSGRVTVQHINQMGEYICDEFGKPVTVRYRPIEVTPLSESEFGELFHKQFPYLNLPPRQSPALLNSDGSVSDNLPHEIRRYRLMHEEGIL